MLDAASEIELVENAILSGLSNCLEWIDDEVQCRVRNDAELRGLTPKGIKQILIDWVRMKQCRIDRRPEIRNEYQDRREFWFRALGAVSDLPRELFIELELTDEDGDCPVVTILNAHL